ncbi:ABC transporter C family member 8-like [Schistocerca gregaria]|uniref:ABC transporter C family member 8-like n=1 Tax=Schistocerca gregaria TaxID=7010 RepID=UPI00211DBF02|nr:ABC transporter C family member 8-like [Schistocerca gregaria]
MNAPINARNDLSGVQLPHDGPSHSRNPFEKLFYASVFRYFFLSFKRPINHSGLWRLRKNVSSRGSWEKFVLNYKHPESREPSASLLTSLLRTFWPRLVLCLVLQTMYSLVQYAIPLLFPYLLDHLRSPGLPMWHGFVYVVAMYISVVVDLIIFNVNCYEIYKLGIQIRSALVGTIFDKALYISPGTITSKGEIINLMSTDSQLILDTFPQFIFGAVAPIQLAITLGILYSYIGLYSLVPLGVLISVLIPFVCVSKFVPRARYASQKAADIRIKLVNEFIMAIRIVKYYAWEKPFLSKIDQARESEIKSLRWAAQLRAILISMLLSFPVLCLSVTLFLYTFSITDPDISLIFTSFTYMSSLRIAFICLPLSIMFLIQYVVSLNRIQTYLSYPEVEPSTFDSSILSDGVAMSIENGSFTWDFSEAESRKESPTLKNINVKLECGKLVAVVGGVGSGKSSLLMAFLQEMKILDGTLRVSSPIAYASQEAFLINATIRENILFGKPYQAEWYNTVIQACSLSHDLDLFPAGDMTEVVEHGSNLSGGQKQRLNLARAMYSNRDIYLFDDSLSAVDSTVCEHLFHNMVMYLHLQKKTILIALNQLNYLQFMEYIYVMHDGKIIEQGTYQELLESGGKLTQLLTEYGIASPTQGGAPSEKSRHHKKSLSALKKKEELLEELKLRREQGAIITEERAQKGVVSLKTYLFYMKSGSLLVYGMFIIAQIFRILFNVYSNLWLASYSNDKVAFSADPPYYSSIYLVLSIGEVLSTTVACFIVIAFVINGSRNIHRKLIKSISHATCSFYDKTPIGRLLSRFSKDIGFVDTLLPWQLEQATSLLFLTLTYMINVAIGSAYSSGIVVVGFFIYVVFLLLFRNPAAQVQRLESTSRAPVFTIFSETLEGLPVIRAFKMQEAFRCASFIRLDSNSVDYLGLRYIFQGFNLHLCQMFNVILLLVMLTFVLVKSYAPESFAVDLVANSLGNSVVLVAILSAFSFNFIEFEARMNSVERIIEYEKVDQESNYQDSESKIYPSWPDKGEIVFKNLTIEYRPNEPVINSLSFHIRAKEKIGIVGRTGAGKSTLITALFRITEPVSGNIVIDDIDIMGLSLFDLRSRLSIIPQVPQIFLGTVRYNLSPFGEHTDEQLWSVLKMVSLDHVVRNMPGMLDAEVDEGGGNFSVGQRQMISMARCLLRDTKILLLDEATASLDIESDTLIQTMIRKHFVNRTVITIAHRLITIIDNDRVMVLDSGKIVEFDSPKALLDKKDGHFYKMVLATGPETMRRLYDLANKKRAYEEVILDDPDILDTSEIM